MAKRTIVLLTDDITGEESENVVSYSFKLPVLDEDGDVGYQRVSFDAEPDTVKAFLDALYKGIQTKYLAKDAVVVKPVSSGESGNVDTEASDMRDFARSEFGKKLGLKVNDRGRISADVRDAYYAAIKNGDWPPFGTKSETDSDTDSK